MKRRTLQVDAQASGRPLRELLTVALPLTPTAADALVTRGAVYVDGKRRVDPHLQLRQGQVVVAVLEEVGRSAVDAPRPAGTLKVLFEDEGVIAVDKAPGVVAQPTAGRSEESLLDQVCAYVGRSVGLVHRLDRETSGVTVFGKTRAATSALAAAFRDHSACKRYLAVTHPLAQGRGEIELRLSRDPSRQGRFRASRTANGVAAHTHFERLSTSADFSLVVLFPTTGRTHQLRAHLRALDAPILGDALYGGAKAATGVEATRCLLHAQGLAVQHPRGKALLLEAPLPADLAVFFALAGVPAPTGRWPRR